MGKESKTQSQKSVQPQRQSREETKEGQQIYIKEILEIRPLLLSFAMSLVKDEDTANDLVQDTYLRALLYSHHFINTTNVKSWIFTILKNTFINQYRLQKRKPMDYRDDLSIVKTEKIHFSPEAEYIEKEILIVLSKLPDRYRIPMELHLSGFKYREIAEKYNKPIGTIKSIIFSARKQILNNL